MRYDTEVDEIPDQSVHKHERVDAGIDYLPRPRVLDSRTAVIEYKEAEQLE